MIAPSPRHYRELLRIPIALAVLFGLFVLREYGGSTGVSAFLDGRRGLAGPAEVIIETLLAIAVAAGVDRALLPLLRRVSDKPSLELLPEGIRYRYRGSHADVPFAEMAAIENTETGPLLRMKNGLVYDLRGYSDEDRVVRHLLQGIAQREDAGCGRCEHTPLPPSP